ncbi:hypothetical protein [Steroidobacter sp.]|uniref:YkvI family membrane protein n=1 Tax=Steroidobacter sp. TaxID=1978227 RepID=UPI001A37B790|nr:hypothetical protein [Steroidobacter sp.]MBL8268995.1 hypothetical protein [Steroidobacter sp.]
MSLRNFLERYIVPGLVIQAVIVGGGYATGRELVEFFVSTGPATGLLGMTVTALLFSVGSMIAFELARRHHAFDYKSFCTTFLGRYGSVVFEIGYFCSLLLVLAVISAAAARLLAEMFGSPELLNTTVFLAIVALLVFFGNKIIERLISAWSVLFYATYLGMFLMVWSKFGDQMTAAIGVEPIRWGTAVVNGVSYTGYNISVLPILIFVARHFTTRSEALIAGALTGPLVLLPGFAFLLALSAFYPQIVSAPLPVTVVLEQLNISWMSTVVQLVILGALFKTGAGLLHGVNERVARSYEDKGSAMPSWLRPLIAVVAMIVAAYFATTIGLIDLIGRGYRYSSAFFLVVFLLPLLTIGAWLVLRAQRTASA